MEVPSSPAGSEAEAFLGEPSQIPKVSLQSKPSLPASQKSIPRKNSSKSTTSTSTFLPKKSSASKRGSHQQSFSTFRQSSHFTKVSLWSTLQDPQDQDDQPEDEPDLTTYNNDNAYTCIKKVYTDVSDSLAKGINQGLDLEPLQEIFAHVWKNVQLSHENEQRLIAENLQVSRDLTATLAKSRFILNLAESNPEYSQKLASRLTTALNQAAAGNEQERETTERIANLKQQISKLQQSIHSASTTRGTYVLKELLTMKEELGKRHSDLLNQSNKLRSELNIIYAQRQEIYERKSMLLAKERELSGEMTAQKRQMEDLKQRKQKILADQDGMQETVGAKSKEVRELQKNQDRIQDKISETQKAIRTQREANETYFGETDRIAARASKLRSELESQMRAVEALSTQSFSQDQELNKKETEILTLKETLTKLNTSQAALAEKSQAIQKALDKVLADREAIKAKVDKLQSEVDQAQSLIESHRNKVDELMKQKSAADRELNKVTHVADTQRNQALVQQVAVDGLEKQVKAYDLEVQAQNQIIQRLEHDRDFYASESEKLSEQIRIKTIEIKKNEVFVRNAKRKLTKLEEQLKKSQQVFESALSDKETLQRQIREATKEIYDLNEELRHLSIQTTSLQHHLSQKEERIQQDGQNYEQTVKETQYFDKQSKRIQRLAQDLQTQNAALEDERTIISYAIAETESELGRHTSYVKSAKSRSDMYHRKLMDREVQLRKTWDQWRKYHSMIRIGASQYKSLMDDILQLRFNILEAKKNMPSLTAALQGGASSETSDSAGGTSGNQRIAEETKLEGYIQRETALIAALQRQLKFPINVHRWRCLEANNPEAYDKVVKINVLTKLVADRRGDNYKLDSDLRQLQNIYVEMRRSYQKCPQFELPDVVAYLKRLVNAKKRQYAQLQQELQVAEAEGWLFEKRCSELKSQLDLGFEPQRLITNNVRRQICENKRNLVLSNE